MENLKIFATYKVVNKKEGIFYMMITGQNEHGAKGIISFGEELDTLLEDDKILGSDIFVLKSESSFEFIKE